MIYELGETARSFVWLFYDVCVRLPIVLYFIYKTLRLSWEFFCWFLVQCELANEPKGVKQ